MRRKQQLEATPVNTNITATKEELLAYINYLKSIFRMHGIHITDKKFTI